MSEIAEQTAEVVAEHVEEAIDGTVEVVEVLRNNPKVAVVAAVFGAVAGGALGYFVAQKKLKQFYIDLANHEIADAKEFYSNFYKVDNEGVTMSPKDVMVERHGVEAAAEALQSYEGRPAGPSEEPVFEGEPYDEVVNEAHIRKMQAKLAEEIKSKKSVAEEDIEEINDKAAAINIFVDNTFDLEEESKYRTADKPYIITHDEFYDSDREYDNHLLTYFEVDDTLVDDTDKPLENVDQLVGEDNLVRFGSGSRDKNIVFIRNEHLGIDYEITRSKGSYLEEVLGMTDDEPGTLKHSDNRDRRRAFRRGDE